MERWLRPHPCRSAGPKKSPSGATPEGQSRKYDQAPLGVDLTTETTNTATTEAGSRCET